MRASLSWFLGLFVIAPSVFEHILAFQHNKMPQTSGTRYFFKEPLFLCVGQMVFRIQDLVAGCISLLRLLYQKYHKLGGLRQQEFIFSQFQRLEVSYQSVGSHALSGGSKEESFSASS